MSTTGAGAVEVVTLGCRLNAAESRAMTDQATQAGLEDMVIVNSCAVTGEAVRQTRQAIRRARRERPGARLVVTGCAAQIAPDDFAAMDEVDHVIGNDAKLHPATWAGLGRADAPRLMVNDIFSVSDTALHLMEGFAGRARAFVQVQNGCDHRCTFCVIPYGRGGSRSAPAEAVIRQVRALSDAGHGEVVLTGVDITSYGHDLPGQPALGDLAAAILDAVPDLPRLRLSSIDAVEIDEVLFRLIAEEERLMPHLHLSLQAGDNMILKRMKRRHLREDAIALTQRLRAVRPDIAFGADIIAGFPTETEEMFANTLALVDECDLAFLHVFPFSPREGTPAARMPQHSRAVIRDRARRLRAKGAATLSRHLDRWTGRTSTALVERESIARMPDFTPVRLDHPAAPGSLVATRVTGHDGAMLIAENTP
jgi:threonylcarbamoyladenosine tRNA methylthiotransferase MtaB